MNAKTGLYKWAIMSLALLLMGTFLVPIGSSEAGSGTLQGYVLDDRFQPVRDVKIKIVSAYYGHTYTVFTDDSGFFSISLPAGSYVLSLNPNGYTVEQISPSIAYVKPGSTVNVEVRLQRVLGDSTLHGYVLNEEGEALEGAEVMLYSRDVAGFSLNGVTNESGYYSVNLPAGSYHVLVVDSGYSYVTEVLDITGDVEKNYTLLMPEGAGYLVYGKVMNSTGEYMSHIEVSLIDSANGHMVPLDKDSFVRTYIFRIKVYPGQFKLIVESEGYTPLVEDITIDGSSPAWINNSIVLEEAPEEDIITEIHFSEDFNASTVTQRWTLSPTTKLYGLKFTAGSPLMQIDRSLGNGDLVIDNTEMQRFVDYLKAIGPRKHLTDGYFTINGKVYEYDPEGGFEVEVNDITGPVLEGEMPQVVYTFSYVAEEGFENPESIQIDVLGLDSGEKLKFFLPEEYEVIENFGEDVGMIDEGNVSIFTAYRVFSFTAKVKEEPVAKITPARADLLRFREEKSYVLNLDDPLNLTAKESYDPVGEIVNYTWAVPGVGEYYGEELNITLPSDGEYNITLTVTDSSSLTSTDWILIYADGVGPAVVAFIQNETGVNVTSADEDETLTFNATLSTDNTEIDTYVWDFGDGTGIITGDVVYHVFRDPGVYNITVNVTDIAGRYTIYTISGFVVRDITPPVAIIEPIGTENAVDVDENVTFNASQSYDPREDPEDWVYNLTLYKWDFDESDGLWWENNKTTPDSNEGAIGKVVVHTYSKPGFYTITLNVTDSAGHTDQTNYTLEVRGADLRVSFVEYEPAEGKITEGKKLVLTINITNKGSVKAEGFTVWVKVGGKKIKSEYISSLEPDATYEFKAVWKNPTAGTKVVNVEIDPTDAVLESDEDNNVYEHTIKIKEKKSQLTTWLAVGIGVLILIYIGASKYYRDQWGYEPILELFRREGGKKEKGSRKEKGAGGKEKKKGTGKKSEKTPKKEESEEEGAPEEEEEKAEGKKDKKKGKKK